MFFSFEYSSSECDSFSGDSEDREYDSVSESVVELFVGIVLVVVVNRLSA